TLVAHSTSGLDRPGPLDFNVDDMVRDIRERNKQLIVKAEASDEQEKRLVRAADQFVVLRDMGERGHSTSILAGYHWFADWGRDALISLPGILLSTKRYAEAKEVLCTFATAVDQGMVPNRFDDYGGAPHYNSVDASVWFVNAAYQYLMATGDKKTFRNEFAPTILEIISSYSAGTRFGIHADSDGLIMGGDHETQLTWMDARCNEVSFTPRYGKAVEINALWLNALHIMAEEAPRKADRQRCEEMAEKAGENFVKLFWNERTRCLNDCVFPDGTVDEAIRPNQIFAVSLPFSVLSRTQQNCVVTMVSEELLTPYGL
ncbi:MAG: glycogen debranching protein, partial [Planctomycetes bacterium]|nr:glycogen debranching protein [Planctomycetota bacterium]